MLVVGFGSIGRRHYQNLKSLGFEDVRLVRGKTRRPGSFDTPKNVRVYHSLGEALRDEPWMVVVATPTSLHFQNCSDILKVGAWILLEKPACSLLNETLELVKVEAESNHRISMAYCFRYHPLYARVSQWCREKKIGRIFHVRIWQAGYLPDWHPWEDYRVGYAARSDLGGGVVRTLDHDLDWLAWTLGRPNSVQATVGRYSDLEVNVEDHAEMIFSYENCIASCHVSFARRHISRGISVSGSLGTIELDWFSGRAELRKLDGQTLVEELPKDFDLNRIYLDMLQQAIAEFEKGNAAIRLCEGVTAGRMAEAALKSGVSHVAVPCV